MEASNLPSTPAPRESNGAAQDWPDDFEVNRDFYLHGAPKKVPQKGRWIPAGVAERPPTQEEIDASEKILDDAASQIEGLPPDFAKKLWPTRESRKR
jgi:hypothetical protein